jgi:hypothetical protein
MLSCRRRSLFLEFTSFGKLAWQQTSPLVASIPKEIFSSEVNLVNDSIPAELLDLKEKFDSWRQTRTAARAPIPEHLWDAAVSLLSRYPASPICRLCRLRPSSLQLRASSQKKKAPSRSASSPAAQRSHSFLQLQTADWLKGSVPQLAAPGSIRLQIERPDGTRLVLSLPVLDSTTINSLCAHFLRGS